MSISAELMENETELVSSKNQQHIQLKFRRRHSVIIREIAIIIETTKCCYNSSKRRRRSGSDLSHTNSVMESRTRMFDLLTNLMNHNHHHHGKNDTIEICDSNVVVDENDNEVQILSSFA